MMGDTHRPFGAVIGATGAALIGANPLAVAAAAGLGYLTATWPDRVEKVGIPHRTLTHHWLVAWSIILPSFIMPPPFSWALLGIGLGWLSHIIGDFMFGKAHTRDNIDGSFTVIRGRGVPAPMKYRGLGLKVGGPFEVKFRRRLVKVMPYIVGLSIAFSIVRWSA